jgi:pectinesterase inhibitor-like protein
MAASTPTLSAILVLFVVAAITGGSVAVGASTELDEVCGGLGGYYVTPELCVSALCLDLPSSSSPPCRAARDANAVAAIAARLAAANATAARDSVQAALSSYAGDATGKTAALRSCLKLYGGVVPALQWAARSVAAGRFRGAREMMQAAQYVPAGCDGMVDGGAALPSENEGFATMATVAHAVLATLSKGY